MSTFDGIPSGPVALLVSSCFSLSSIAFGVIIMSVMVIPFEYFVGSSSGSSFLFSIVKTLAKNLFKVLALSRSVIAKLPSDLLWSIE